MAVELGTQGPAIQTGLLAQSDVQLVALIARIETLITAPVPDPAELRDALATLSGAAGIPLASVTNAGPVAIRNTAANFTSGAAFTAPATTLLAGQMGYETDTGKWKIGNGSTAWAALTYAAAGASAWADITGRPAALTAADLVAFDATKDGTLSGAVIDAESALASGDAALALVEGILENEDVLAAVTAADMLAGVTGYFAYDPAAMTATWAPYEATIGAITHAIDASVRQEQIFTCTGNVTIGSCTQTRRGPIIVRYIASGGTRTISKGAGMRSDGAFPFTLTTGQELTLQIQVSTAGGSTRSDIVVWQAPSGAAPAVNADITSTAITPPWSNTAGATFSIAENGVGNPTPTKTRTMEFNGVATAETGVTWAAPVGKKGGGIVHSQWVNAGATDTFDTEYWVGKRQPKYIGAVTAQRHGGAGSAAVAMTLPVGSLAGHKAILYTNQLSAVDVAPPTGFSALDAPVPRAASVPSGSNHHFQIFEFRLTATEISAGSITVQLNDNSMALLEIWNDFGAGTAVWVSDANPANWTRSALLGANSITTPAFTTTDAAALIAVVWSGHYADGAKSVTAAGWTGGAVDASTNVNAAANGIRTLHKRQVSNETTAAFVATATGTATMTLQSSLLALYGPVNT